MKKTVMREYARLIVRVGANVRKGQPVMVRAGLDQPEFIKMLVEECYRAGASEVEVDWEYMPLLKLANRWEKVSVMGAVKEWEEKRALWRAEKLPAFIYIESHDPDGLKGMDQKKRAKCLQMRYKVLKPINDSMENKYQWCIAAVPGPEWAKKVFPELRVSAAQEKLWELILDCSRANGDGIANWQAHNADLKARCDYLNSLGLRELEYRAANGTDLRVGLIPEGIFCGGSDKLMTTGVEYNPNIPSEEIFCSPMAGKAEGIVYGSRPLAYRGQLIEDFWIRFEDGKAVEVHAEKNEEALKAIIAMDEGSAKLGECALVPYDSPIRRSGVLFYNTLFDENAACHLALGMGFSGCLKDYEKYTLEQARAMGINDSMVHEDFMIGTADLSVTGVTEKGERVQIFKDGGWAF